jgi:hypothetical protein
MGNDYSKDTPVQAKEKMAGYGSKVAEFNQTKFRTKLGKGVIKEVGDPPLSLGNGYCLGVGLDWIRRVLQSKAVRDPRYLNYSYDALLNLEGKKDSSPKTIKTRALDTSVRMAEAWYRQTEQLEWKGPKGGDTKAVLPDEWKKNVVGPLDRDLDDSREERKRKESKKRFSNLNLLSSKSTTYAEPRIWMDTILADSALPPGCCVLAGFCEKGNRGHAIVVWRRRENKNQHDSYYLFDPNYGVFSYTEGSSENTEGLRAALKYLFWRDKDDVPLYADCASLEKQEVNYMVFGPPNTV